MTYPHYTHEEMIGKTAPSSYWLLVIGILLNVRAGDTAEANAYVNLSYFSDQYNTTITKYCECGLFGLNSPINNAQGVVGIPISPNLQGCDPSTKYSVTSKPWIALIERGNCTFSEKILLAASKGAHAVVIYNAPPSTGNQTIPMVHYGTKDTIAIMIGYLKGMEIVELIRNRVQVTMVIEVGKKHGSFMNQYSIFFVSISFFVVTAATVGYFIFYSARRWRHTRAQNQKMKRLKDEAKKAIGRLQLRTIKQGDKVLGPDGDSCAVCIEAYKANDVVRILTCNHFFHKNCIDPWLLEHRTCPMCKCDILKSLGIAADEEEQDTSVAISSVSSEVQQTTMQVEEETRSDNASSGYASVRGLEELTEEPENLYENVELVNNDASATAVEVLPHMDNPTFESEDVPHIQSVKS
ncbi:E3 ubiquitin-protein ligase RNF128 isoform 2-T2 [Leptodactylus fuscus]|uniref:E3 ubiquitin-protein ligase RNF128 isoform X2 n=1 Tax=Leptodactylus fuscus TaxID=238119 RepID=UPI003F4F117F